MAHHLSLPTTLLLVTLIATATPAPAAPEAVPPSFANPTMPLTAVGMVVMPRLDVASLLAEDALRDAAPSGGPTRFAQPFATSLTTDNSGTWEVLADGERLWRLRIVSPGALSLNLGLTRFDLPEGASLWLYDPQGELVQGPYTREQRSPEGELWTAMVLGDEVVVELHLAGAASVGLEIARVNHGYRFFGEPRSERTKQGSCNNDVICPEGNPWRDQIRAVGWYTLQGFATCSGTLLNNTARDFTPYFLTAKHCDVTSSNASSVVVYWNYESPVCGALSGGSLEDNQTGAVWRADWQISDFALLELSRDPDEDFNVYFAGWDVTGDTPQGAVGIHHPNTDEKAISFDNDPLISSWWTTPSQLSHWQIESWDDGTTEPGSSGSCIFDPLSKLCIGTLSGGQASCSNQEASDWYGKLSASFSGGGTTSSRLGDWLDPADTGQLTLQGAEPGTVAGDCTPDAETMCLNDGRFQVELTWLDFQDNTGNGQVVSYGSDDSGLFWFFEEANWEMLVKVLDGCAVNNHYWVFGAATTNVDYTLIVTDTANGTVMRYHNPLGTSSPAITDATAFRTCP